MAAALFGPWSRPGRDVFAWPAEGAGWRLIGAAWPIGLAVAAAAAVVLVATLRWPPRRAGLAWVALGLVGTAAAAWSLGSRGQPFGAGAVLTILACLAVLGIGLSRAGLLQTDAFLATAILWVAIFVGAFILYPLVAVLQAAVVIEGRLSLEAFRETFASPGFLLVENPATPEREWQLVAWRTLVALAAGAAVTWSGLGARFGWALTWPARLRWTAIVGVLALVFNVLGVGIGALRNSVLLALIVGTLATAFGFAFALLGERSHLPVRRWARPLTLLPIITPPFILGLAMIYLFGRRGFVTYTLLGLSINIVFGPIGVAAAQVLAFTPIAYLVLTGVVRALNVTLEEAAEVLGASRWHVLRTVIWPLARPGIANAWLLVVIESLADFGNPLILGGGVPFLATEVFYAVSGRFNPHEASVYGVVLLAMTLSVFLAQRYWVGRRSYVTVTGKPTAASQRPLPLVFDYAAAGVFCLWAAVILALYGSILVGSLVKLWGFDNTVTLQNYRDLSPTGWQVFWGTVRLAAIAAVPSAGLGFLIGYLVTRVRFPGRDALEFASILSFAVPGTVMGIGYILAFNEGPLFLTGTETILVLAFVFRNMPVGIRSGIAAVHQIDVALEEASITLRAGAWTTLRRVVVPLARLALVSGLVFAFVRAMTAVSQVIFLVSPSHNLVTALILSWVEYGTIGRGAALSAVLVVTLVVAIAALYLGTARLGPEQEVGPA
ncbi:MAG: iron ABC transporter permease [Candidatus Rokubacteria bacterium]|nr:iron ABC transporter permease [Candidatus Rokubacteria bacterium]